MVNNKIESFDQLIAPGTTAAITVTQYKHYTIQYKVASVDTNVVVRFEGSLDGTNFGSIGDASDTTKTQDNTYLKTISNTPLAKIRFRWVSEAGGTAATIDPILMVHE